MKMASMRNFALSLLASAGLLTMAAPSVSKAESGTGFSIGIGIMKLDTETDGPNLGDNKLATTILNGKAGYTMANGLFFGGIYDSRADEANGSKNERSGYGVTLGYHNSGWFLDGSYFINSTIKLAGGTELSGGSGFGADLGRNFDLTPNIYLGLQVSYRSFTYTKTQTADATNKYKSEMVPLLNLGLMF